MEFAGAGTLLRSGWGMTRHPRWELQANFRLPYANLLKKGLIGKVLAEHRRIWFAPANLFILLGRPS
jgi:hypothetical protein